MTVALESYRDTVRRLRGAQKDAAPSAPGVHALRQPTPRAAARSLGLPARSLAERRHGDQRRLHFHGGRAAGRPRPVLVARVAGAPAARAGLRVGLRRRAGCPADRDGELGGGVARPHGRGHRGGLAAARPAARHAPRGPSRCVAARAAGQCGGRLRAVLRSSSPSSSTERTGSGRPPRRVGAPWLRSCWSGLLSVWLTPVVVDHAAVRAACGAKASSYSTGVSLPRPRCRRRRL